MGRTKELLDQLTEEQLRELEILHEIIGAECDDSELY